MSEETHEKYRLPELISHTELPQKALEFVYGASVLIKELVSDLESGATEPEKGHSLLRHILADIRRELTEFPTKPHHGESPDVYCSDCLTKFNTCHLPQPQCLANYWLCSRICQQG